MRLCKLTLILLFISGVGILRGQKAMGIELQVYPTGIIPSISFDIHHNEKESTYFRVGGNLFDHRSLGVHDQEIGAGLGGSLGYKRYLSHKKTWRLGLKSDLWWNHVDWEDYEQSTVISGSSEIVVLQPTLELGYVIRKSSILIIPSFAFGYEWNIHTKGEETGQGAIILLGISLSKEF